MKNLRFLTVSALIAAMAVLGGCGSDKKKDDSNDKPADQRVQMLQKRFGELENSLDEMERDLKIQKQRIESTREKARNIRQSLAKGNLKGYSIDLVSTETAGLANAKAKNKDKKGDKEGAKDKDKKEAENSILDALLILLFLAFIAVIFFVALKDRKQDSPNDLWPPAYPDTKDPDAGPAADAVDNTGGYQQLGPQNEPHHDHGRHDEGHHGDHHHSEGDHNH